MYSSTLAQLGQWKEEQERTIRREEAAAKHALPAIKVELARMQNNRAILEEYLTDPSLKPAERTEYQTVLQETLQAITGLTERKRFYESVRASLTERFKQQTAVAITASTAQHQARQAQERERGTMRRELAKKVLSQLGQVPSRGGGMRGFVQRLLKQRRGT